MIGTAGKVIEAADADGWIDIKITHTSTGALVGTDCPFLASELEHLD